MRRVHINGKWLGQRLTGTQRYASELARAIASSEDVGLVLHVPRGAEAPAWAAMPHIEVRYAPLHGVAFEQIYLPLATAGQLLLNFAGPAPLLKRRQLVTMHDASTFRFPQTFRRSFVAFYYVMYFVLARTARQLVTVSNFSATELAQVLRVGADRFLVVACAADGLASIQPERPALAVDSDHYVVVGTLAKHKNLSRSVTAITNSDRKVVVVGIAGSKQVFARTAELNSNAIVAGRLTDSELVWLYRHSRALIFPSHYEGFGLPVIEAQILSCPVVSSSSSALPETGGDAALYFDPDDTGQLLAQLDRLENDPELADDLRSRGLLNVQRFSWRQSADKILAWVRSELA